MTSKAWSRRYALGCAISALAVTCGAGFSQQTGGTPGPAPAIALINTADAAPWQALAAAAGWRVVSVPGDPDPTLDQSLLALAAKVAEEVKSGAVDAARVYVAGRGEAAAGVFYAIARMPDRWAAGVALGGSPKPALDTNRIFAANFLNTPILWASSGADDEALAQRLRDAGLHLEWRSAAATSNEAIIQWLSAHRREEFPPDIDCETNSPSFASCYWIQMTKFDAAERNDVLSQTVIAGDAGTSLDLGGFAYRISDPGPGVLVAYLPRKIQRPAQAGRPHRGAGRQTAGQRPPVGGDPAKGRRNPRRGCHGAARQGSDSHRDPHRGASPQSHRYGARRGALPRRLPRY